MSEASRDGPGMPRGPDPAAGGWLSAQVLSQGADGPADERASERLAAPEGTRYRATALLGQGGMGRVEAVFDARLSREVARKTPHVSGERSPSAGLFEGRLVREALVTARIDHPGVVPVLDAGLTADGHAYYTMPIVRGQTLEERLSFERESGSSRPSLLRRLLEAIEAVAAAHAQGVVHGDLKPANVMLGALGGTRVLDWGLARLLDEPWSDQGVVGTPQYMSPEQAAGRPFDARSDVWSLGAILYEVIAGEPLRDKGRSTEILASISLEREVDISKIEMSTPGELLAILKRALAVDPERRYPNASELAADLERFLDGRRVSAHDYSARELLMRLFKAWRVPLIVAGVAVMVLAAVIAVGISRLANEVVRAEAAAERASQAEQVARGALEMAARDYVRALLSQARLESQRGARAEAELLAAHVLSRSEDATARGILLRWGAAAAPRHLASRSLPGCLGLELAAEGHLLCKEADALSSWRVTASGLSRSWSRPLHVRAVSQGDGVVAAFTSSTELALLDAASGEQRSTFVTPCERAVLVAGGLVHAWNTGCFASTGIEREVASGQVTPCAGRGLLGAYAVDVPRSSWAVLCEDGTLVEGAIGAGPERRIPTPLSGATMGLAMARTDRASWAVGLANGGLVELSDEGQVTTRLATGLTKVTALVVGPSGRAAVLSAGGEVVLADLEAGLLRGRLPDATVRAMRFDGAVLTVAGRELDRYEVPRGAPAEVDVSAGVTSVAFSPDGQSLAITTGAAFEVRAVADGTRRARVEVGEDFIKNGAFSRDGRLFFVGTVQRSFKDHWELRSWDTASWREASTTMLAFHVRRLVTLRDDAVLVAPYTGGVDLHRPGAPPRLALLERPQRIADLAASPSGRFAVAIGQDDGLVSRVDAHGQVLHVGHAPGAVAVDIGDDGELIAAAGEGGVWLFEAASARHVDTLPAPDDSLTDVALSPDLRWLAAGSRDGEILVWSLPEGVLNARAAAHGERVSSLAFSPDGALLASGSWDGLVRLYALARLDMAAPALLAELERVWGRGLDAVVGARAGATP